MRTPFVVIAVLVVALLGLDAAFGGGASAPPAPQVAPVGVIARRVAVLRELRWKRVPPAVAVSPAQARREGLADFDRSTPEAVQRTDEAVLRLLALVPAGFTLRASAASLYGQGVAGYYDPRTKRLRIVSGAATGTRVLTETTLAHELTHAIEDQRFPLLAKVSDAGSADSDSVLAALALVEGSATTVMEQYMQRYFTPSAVLAGTLASAFSAGPSMPRFIRAQTEFPYLGGAAFVRALLDRAGGRWDIVDVAERVRPPISTEQVLHPDRYLRADEPVRVRLAGGPGPGWVAAGTGTWGELQTRAMLAAGGVAGAIPAAAGWGGDRWRLWRRGSCGAACEALAMRWRWDTRHDVGEFAGALRAYVRSRLPGRAVVAVHRGAVTLAIAPSPGLARRLAAR